MKSTTEMLQNLPQFWKTKEKNLNSKNNTNSGVSLELSIKYKPLILKSDMLCKITCKHQKMYANRHYITTINNCLITD